MRAVTIHDKKAMPGGGGVLAFDLADLLQLSKHVLSSTWVCKHVECMGELASDLHGLSDSGLPVNGSELLRLASNVYQVIDGDFVATLPCEQYPWLIIRAIDSSEYVVATNDDDFLEKVRERFKDVRDSPDDAGYVA